MFHVCRNNEWHVGRDADGYDGMGFGTRNAEGERISEFADSVGTTMCNTFVKSGFTVNFI